MNELGDNENDSHKVAETLARESHTSKDIIIKNINKTHFVLSLPFLFFPLHQENGAIGFLYQE